MLQDIAPHKLNITYQPMKPQKDSRIMFFEKDMILVKQEADSDFIEFPKYHEVEAQTGELTYLFTLDETAFFRSVETVELDSSLYQYRTRHYFRTVAPKEFVFAALTAMHLNGWYQKNIHCGCCGNLLIPDENERMLRCPECGNMVFPRINPAIIVAVMNKDRLLMTKYRGREYKKYALVAGFNEIGETLEETVSREVMEEAGLKVKNIRYYKSQPWGMADNILVGYFCELDGDDQITMDEEELAVAQWIKREDIEVKPEDFSLTNEMICRFITKEYPGCME